MEHRFSLKAAGSKSAEQPPLLRGHQPVRREADDRANPFTGNHHRALANQTPGLTERQVSPANRSNPYTYEHVPLDSDHSWTATEEAIGAAFGPYGLADTPQGVRITTLPRLGACREVSLILNVPLCSGCDEPITDGCCHNCEVVFHKGLPGEPIL